MMQLKHSVKNQSSINRPIKLFYSAPMELTRDLANLVSLPHIGNTKTQLKELK